MERVGVLFRNKLRNWKDLSIVVITLSSRSAIEGGLSLETAFSMSDAFIQQIEDENDMEKLLNLCRKAELEFCLAVRKQSHSATQNPAVLRCRDLIAKRAHTRLTVAELAEALHISPDYLSQLFSREEGMTLSAISPRAISARYSKNGPG